ncbi:hypothetical protein D1872_319920 [compost metagenome]
MLRVSAMLTLVTPLLAFRCFEVTLITKVHQGTKTLVYTKDHMATFSTITARWTSIRHILLTTERYESIPAIAAFDINFGFIYKHAISPSLCLTLHPHSNNMP